MAVKPDMYFSLDIEADGPYPGRYSMLSIGMVACATYDGRAFLDMGLDKSANQFYMTMKPVTKFFVPEAVEVCKAGGVDRADLLIQGYEPGYVMPHLVRWVEELTQDKYRPVAVAYPLGFDWMWFYYYVSEYSPINPFGFSGCLDIKSMYAAKANALIVNSTKRNMPGKLKSKRPHTHNAIDDAIEQAELFRNIWRWEGK